MKFSKTKDRQWAANILKQANYICEVCGKQATDPHHLKSRRYKDNRYSIGIALCHECHMDYHNHPWQYEVIIKTKVTLRKRKEDYSKWK